MSVDKVGHHPFIPDLDLGGMENKGKGGKKIGDDFNTPPPPSPPPDGGSRPNIPFPSLDAGQIMTMLMELQSKITQERIRTGKEDIEQRKTEMQKLHQERMKKLEKYWDKMAEAASKSTGFFGKLFSGLKKYFKGDIKGALEDLKEGFKAKPFTAIMFSLAILATAGLTVAIGPVGLVVGLGLTAVFFAPQALSDPEVVKMIADATGSSVKTVQWWCMGFAIGISIAIALGLCFCGGAAGLIAGAVTGLVEGGMLIETAVRNYQASQATEQGLKASAGADKLQASYEKIEEDLKRAMDDVRDIMESIASEMQKAMETIMDQGRVQMAMAAV